MLCLTLKCLHGKLKMIIVLKHSEYCDIFFILIRTHGLRKESAYSKLLPRGCPIKIFFRRLTRAFEVNSSKSGNE
uniref:Uncharacterized protein n=1 Tax=Anguilla anguilla TaxID=7936 RepID=A0A0E9WHZ3_ANGAN